MDVIFVAILLVGAHCLVVGFSFALSLGAWLLPQLLRLVHLQQSPCS